MKEDWDEVKTRWELHGLEPVLVTKKTSETKTSIIQRPLFYPIRRVWFILKNCYKYARLLMDDETPEICQMCGEAIADTYMINPNPGKMDDMHVCSRCKDWVHRKQDEDIRRFIEHQR